MSRYPAQSLSQVKIFFSHLFLTFLNYKKKYLWTKYNHQRLHISVCRSHDLTVCLTDTFWVSVRHLDTWTQHPWWISPTKPTRRRNALEIALELQYLKMKRHIMHFSMKNSQNRIFTTQNRTTTLFVSFYMQLSVPFENKYFKLPKLFVGDWKKFSKSVGKPPYTHFG